MLLLCPQLTRGQRSSGVAIFIELTGCEEVGETNLDFGAPFHLNLCIYCPILLHQKLHLLGSLAPPLEK